MWRIWKIKFEKNLLLWDQARAASCRCRHRASIAAPRRAFSSSSASVGSWKSVSGGRGWGRTSRLVASHDCMGLWWTSRAALEKPFPGEEQDIPDRFGVAHAPVADAFHLGVEVHLREIAAGGCGPPRRTRPASRSPAFSRERPHRARLPLISFSLLSCIGRVRYPIGTVREGRAGGRACSYIW